MTARGRVRRVALSVVARALGLRQPSAPLTPAPNRAPRILLIRPDHLGDLLLSGPAISALRSALPEAELVLAVGPWNVDVARRLPDVTRTVTIEFPGFTRRRKRDPFAPYRYLRACAARLGAERFDAAVVMRDDHWWGGLLAAAAAIPLRLGYATRDLAPLLTAALPLPIDLHAARSALRLSAALATSYGRAFAPPDDPGYAPLRFTTTRDDEAVAHQLIAPIGRGVPLVAIHPGSGAPVKLWEEDRWATVIDHLSADGYTMLLTGASSEVPLAREIAARTSAPTLNLAGRTGVGELAAIFRRCSLVMGPDSGALHVAVASGAPTVHLFGPASASKFGPWGPPSRHLVVDAGLRCGRCGDLGTERARGAPCMLAITTDMVLAAARQLLRGDDGART